MRLTHAIVCPPGDNFANGLTTSDLGPPDLALARSQHEAYIRALEECGLTITRLKPDPRFPDSPFVEDMAVVTARGALITRPGVECRQGEVAVVGQAAILGEGPPDLVCEIADDFPMGKERLRRHGIGQFKRLQQQAACGEGDHEYDDDIGSCLDARGIRSAA